MSHKSLIFRYFRFSGNPLLAAFFLLGAVSTHSPAAEPDSPPYTANYDPAKGFKPVQSNLTKVFLQMAGSLESSGTPEPYIRHVIAEHVRIDAKHHASGGKGSSRPAYLTDEYIENLIANWNKISQPLKLEPFCRDAGRNMRHAILGSQNMAVPELVSLETSLNDAERKAYRHLLEKPYFKKTDVAEINAFYGNPYDKLTVIGKGQLSQRIWLGTQAPDERQKQLEAPISGTALVKLFNEHQERTVAFLEDRSKPKATAATLQQLLMGQLKLGQDLNLSKGLSDFDAEPLIYSHKIQEGVMFRIESVTKQAQTAEQAASVIGVLKLMLENVVIIAQSEFEAGVCEKASKLRGE